MTEDAVPSSATTSVVRALGPDDWQAYRRIRLAMLLDSPAAFATNHANARLRTEAQWRQVLRDCHHYLAERGGEVVGAAGFIERRAVVDLIGMWVAPAHRGRDGTGAGRLLAEAVVQGARDRGHDRLLLDVVADNSHAQRFYERLGFVQTGRIQGVPGREEDLEIQMVLRL